MQGWVFYKFSNKDMLKKTTVLFWFCNWTLWAWQFFIWLFHWMLTTAELFREPLKVNFLLLLKNKLPFYWAVVGDDDIIIWQWQVLRVWLTKNMQDCLTVFTFDSVHQIPANSVTNISGGSHYSNTNTLVVNVQDIFNFGWVIPSAYEVPTMYDTQC